MYRMSRWTLLQAAAVASLAAAAARAQDAAPAAVPGEAAGQLPPVLVAAEPLTPAATSTVTRAQIQQQPPLVPSEIFTDVPGVWQQNDGGPGLSVSIRGLQDFGRVNVMVDGARQNFQVSGHGANGTVYVDPALLARADVTRGTVSTVNGAGAIGGVVDLRTIGIEDILLPGQTYGAMGTGIAGTNHYDGSGMVAFGVRPNDVVNVAGAFSTRSSGNYADGSGTIQPGTSQKLYSGLFKVEVAPAADQLVRLGAIIYDNSFGSFTEGVNSEDHVSANTFTAKYDWAPAGSNIVDLHLNGYLVQTRLTEATDAFFGVTPVPADTATFEVLTLGATADNTSRATLGPVVLAFNYGGEYFHDNVTSSSAVGSATETPSGNRGLGGLFGQVTASYGIVSLIGGLRGDAYDLSGSGVNSYPFATGLPVGPFSTNISASAVSPKGTLAVTPIKGLQFYGSYGDGWRPPALTETLFAGVHPGLSFLRFLPNPTLGPESTHGWELGASAAYADVVRPDDAMEIKADYFHTDIDDYIAQYLTAGRPAPGSRIPSFLYQYRNVPGTTRTEGFELQASYDAGVAFGRLAYSNILTSLPATQSLAAGAGAVPTEPPRNVFSGTLGMRLFEQRLTLGARVRLASATQAAGTFATPFTSVPGYTVVDLFSSLRVTDTIRLFASMQNIGNRTYRTDILSPTAAPGLTALFGLTASLGR